MARDSRQTQERWNRILEFLRDNSPAGVDQLAERFSVTPVTIRSDLRELARRDLISRIHGAAMYREQVGASIQEWRDPSYVSRTLQNQSFKERIGRKIASLVHDGDSIMLDDGSTNLQVAKHLPANIRLTVITNGLNICLELSEHPNIEVIELGGILNKTDLSYYGVIAEEIASRFNANMAILGASAVTPEKGLMAPDEHKAGLKKQMLGQTGQVVIVADYTKLSRISLVPVCPVSDIDTLVTNQEAPPDLIARFQEQGVNVILA